jgi:hypothetical protein
LSQEAGQDGRHADVSFAVDTVTLILPDVLYGCETSCLSLSLREEHIFVVFKYRVKRKIFVPKRFEVTGG